MTKNQGFTLIELLIAIALIAILETVVVLVFNPAELLRKTRDSTRLADLQTLNQVLAYSQLDNLSMGASSIVYVSLPADAEGNCPAGLPSPLPDGWSYVCKSQADYRKTNGDGWVPVNFSQLSTIKAQLAVLPIDPVNSATNGLYYTYTIGGLTDSPWELTDPLESSSYQIKYADTDNGISATVYEIGKNIGITPAKVIYRTPEENPPLEANGSVCETSNECQSGNCVDGYCCNTACGTCQSCKIAGYEGTCTNVPDGEIDDTCQTAHYRCDGNGSCTNPTELVNAGGDIGCNRVCKNFYYYNIPTCIFVPNWLGPSPDTNCNIWTYPYPYSEENTCSKTGSQINSSCTNAVCRCLGWVYN